MEKMKLEFSIFGDKFEPSEVTKIINIAPTKVWFIGDEINEHPNLIRKARHFRKETCWEYSIKLTETLDMEEIIDIYFKTIHFSEKELLNYVKKINLSVKFEVVVWMNCKKSLPSLGMTSKFIQHLAKLNASLDFDLYAI